MEKLLKFIVNLIEIIGAFFFMTAILQGGLILVEDGMGYWRENLVYILIMLFVGLICFFITLHIKEKKGIKKIIGKPAKITIITLLIIFILARLI